ncbi:ficolin-1-like [Saccostrea echinata]|uniref:ficolin-1-like n=1 Tax=Saccostrea echinata TaxID=191078 RepID=UPI002A7EF866|nr:ficolin-1-like [Saccostrea echinata]
MADLRVEMSSEKDAKGKKKLVSEEPRGSGNASMLTFLALTFVLAAAVYYPNSLIVAELRTLIQHQTNYSGNQAPRDCYDILTQKPNSTSGVYRVYPGALRRGIDVLCDMDVDEGGWLVIQKRLDGSLDFFREWADYQFGFSDGTSEFWIGNEFLHLLTSQALYELRVDMTDFDGESRFAKYKVFVVGSRETKFRLTIGGYSGTAGDSLSSHNGMFFSTKDFDNDLASGNCAASFKGGFWYSNCHTANPNGQYLKGNHESMADGINWKTWRGYKYSLQTFSMKIKPL